MKWLSYLAVLVLGAAIGFLGATFKVATVIDDSAAEGAGPGARPSARVAELEAEVARLTASARAADAARQIQEAGSAEDAVAAAPPEEGSGGGGGAMSALAGMMDNPVMREQIKQQLKGQIGATFGQLFEGQGFSPVEVAALSEVLLERQLALTEASMGAMSGGGLKDKEKRDALSAEIKAVTERYDEELKALLGDAKFDEFQRFEKTQVERQQIDSLRSQLAGTEHPLSEAAEQQLMDAMWEVREDPRFGKGKGGNMDEVMAGKAIPDDPAAMVTAFSEMQAAVRDRAGAFLVPEQVEALETNQKAFLDMMEMGLKMSAEMMGSSGPGTREAVGTPVPGSE
ncbi:hypothetical protein BH23VER1_BH23VER1_19460 [soil metagenome]